MTSATDALLIAGLFPCLAERRRVSVDYFIDLGQGAYGEVAHCSRAGMGAGVVPAAA